MATIIGTNGNNTLNGGSENDIIFARGGADTVTGGDGNDVVLFEISPPGSDYFDGGTGDDAVLLDLELDQFEVSALTALNSDNELILFDTVDGVTLTVTNVEKIGFLDAVGYIVGFGSEIAGIQAALDQAAAGDVVAVQGGAYVGNFTIGSAVSVLGIDSNSTGVSVSAASGNVFSLAGNLGVGNVVAFENVAVTGGGNGISVSSTTQLGLLAVSGMDFSGLSGSGIITGSGAPGLGTVVITDTTFTGVGATGAATANGSGSIVLFGFNGDAAIVDVAITNALTEGAAVNTRPDHAINITGYDPATYDVTEPAGTISLSDVTIEGTFHKNAISIQGFTSLSGITFDNVDVTGASDWGYLVFIDPIASTGDGAAGVNGYPGNFAGGEATSVIDLSGLTVTNLSTNDVGFDVFVRGTDAADTQTGTDARDVLNAHAEGGIDYGGDDVLFGMGGNDTLFAGLGDDSLDGGSGTDTAVYTGSVTDYTITDVRDSNGVVTGFTAVTDNNAGDGDDGSDTLASVEIVQFADAVIDASLGVQMFDGADNLVGTFATIQEAVDAAADGYSIMLKTGTYQEQVVVDGIDNLTIAAFDGADVTILAPADVVETARSGSDREVHAVVTVLNADNVTISGVEVDGDGRANTISEGGGAGQANYYGVFYRNASGGLDNVDVTGVRDPYPGGNTAGGSPIVSGNQRGVGVVVDNDALMSFFMHGGSISDFQKNATAFAHADLDISGVTITGGGAQTINAQNGIQASFSTGTIDGNTITGIGYAGAQVVYSGAVLLFGNTDLNVTNNTIVGANDEDLGAQVGGIFVLDFGSALYTNSGGQITGNDISFVDFAIDVSGAVDPDTILIENNTLSDLDTADQYHEGVGLFVDSSSPAAFDTEGSDFTDYLNGATQADTFDGFGGDDFLYGAAGNDTLNGGDGTDTASYDGNVGDFTLATTTDGGGFVNGFTGVTDNNLGDGDEGVDTLTGIERIEFADGAFDLSDPVQLFDQNGDPVASFASIQDAVDAAGADYTLRISAGTYNENVVIDVEGLTIIGAPGAVLQGTFLSDNAVTGPLNEWLEGRASYSGVAGTGLSIEASNVTVEGLTISGFLHAIDLGANQSGTELTGLALVSNFMGLHKPGDVEVTDFTFTDTEISDGHIGVDITASQLGGSFDQVLFDNVDVFDMNRKGYYFEALSNAVLTNFDMSNVGEWGGIPATGSNGQGGNGININLKFDDFANIEISEFILTNVGSSDRDGLDASGHANGGAIVVAARDDGGTYGADPATLTNVTIHDGTIDGTSTGIEVGEPARANATPDVTVTNVAITNAQNSALHGEIGNQSAATLTVTGTAGNDTYEASGNSDGSIVIDGGAGDDTLSTGSADDELTGGADDDTLDGNGGIDTAIVGTGVGFDATGTSWTVTSSDGADSLTDIEIVEDGDGGTTLLVGSGGFTSIQAAVDAAGSIVGAVTILVADGTYNENVVIDRGDLTLLSVNGRDAVTIGDGTGSALGTIEIDPGVNNVSIGGVGQGFTVIGLNGNGAIEKSAIYLQGSHDGISILDNEIVANGDAGLSSEFSAAITNALIDGNEFSGQTFVGAQPGGEGFGTQFDVGNNVPRQLVVLGNGNNPAPSSNNITFTNNLVSGTAGGISSDTGNPQGNTLVTIDAANSLIADNTFTGFTDRFGVAIRARGPDTDIVDNTLEHTSGGQSRGIEVNFQGVPGTYTGNVVNGAATAELIFGMTPGADVVNGNGGDDVIAGAAGDDQLFGGADDDTLVGQDGNDLLDGGTGNDTLTGGLGDDTYRVDSNLDVVVENAAEGTDTIETTLSSYTLADDLENLTFIGIGNFVGNGNIDDNVVTGGAGNDRLAGGRGDDTLYGLEGNDRLYGHGGSNTLVGGEGDDYYNITADGTTIVELVGGGDDRVASHRIDVDLALFDNVETGVLSGSLDLNLFGSSRDDLLYGNDGDNVITGRAGVDTMIGGAGSDTFAFESLADTGNTKAAADRIRDFDGGIGGTDLIDLFGIDAKASSAGNNAFVWIGTDAFSGSEGELRYSFLNANQTRIDGDVDGDGVADFSILLVGNIDLYDGNFIL